MDEFILASNNSKQTLREWNDYLQKGQSNNNSSIMQTSSNNNHPQYYLKRLNETIQFYTNASSVKRMKWAYNIYQWSTYSLIFMNLFDIFTMLAYWLILVIFGCFCRYGYNSDNNDNEGDNRLKRFILITFTMVILQTWMFDSHLVITMANSDFCLSAKQSIADMAVYKFPENNFTMPMVNYYLDCDLPKQLNLQEHKHNVINYLDSFDRLEIFKLPVGKIVTQNWNFIDSIKKNLIETYQTMTCEHLNEIINRGLSQYCSQPIDGLTLLTTGHFIHFLLTLIMLFIVTFAY